MTPRTGATILSRSLRRLGATTVFGVAGSQNVALLEELRRERIHMISGTSELTSSFIANGHARVTREPAVLTTIPGPGFAYALPGVAEALLDSVPLVWMSIAPEEASDGRRTLQQIPQAVLAAPIVKRVFEVREAKEIDRSLSRAFVAASQGDPGPVLLHLHPGALRSSVDPHEGGGNAEPGFVPALSRRAAHPGRESIRSVGRELRKARRPVLFAGQGVLDAPSSLRSLAEALGAPVLTTTSARGVIPEDHPLAIAADRPGESPDGINRMLERADLILALGCGFSHNGAHGFRVALPSDRLIHVNSSSAALGRPYPARVSLHCDLRTFFQEVSAGAGTANGSEWTAPELEFWRKDLARSSRASGMEPQVPGLGKGSMETLFLGLRAALPPDAMVVTDSGRHQMLTRRYFTVLRPGGLVVPANFQSMGFGVPAALGVRAADRSRPVVAVVGDGGFHMSATELLVARREGLDVGVIVFNDGEFGLIADQQRRDYGRATATKLQVPDMRGLARSLGCRFLRMDGTRRPEEVFAEMVRTPGVVVVDIPLVRSANSRVRQARGLARETVHRLGSARVVDWVREAFGLTGSSRREVPPPTARRR